MKMEYGWRELKQGEQRDGLDQYLGPISNEWHTIGQSDPSFDRPVRRRIYVGDPKEWEMVPADEAAKFDGREPVAGVEVWVCDDKWQATPFPRNPQCARRRKQPGSLTSPHISVYNPIRRCIDPGEGWEIVPAEEAIQWNTEERHGIEGYYHDHWGIATHPSSASNGVTYRRRKQPVAPAPAWGWIMIEPGCE